MRVLLALGCLATASMLPAVAQSACSPSTLRDAAGQVATVRQGLQRQAVGLSDPVVPPSVGAQLTQLKDALTVAANAAFGCASATDTPEQLQTRLAEALHANLPMAETSIEINGKQDIGTYGSDLAVQVSELFGKPRLFEVDFRYGIECGDDHLLLVFAAESGHNTAGWREQLRWDTGQYKTVGDALGDFVLLTPLTGSYKNPAWRYVVAHGHPGCADSPRPSTFGLDLLTPTADPAKPEVAWHFEHGYTQGNTTPRLVTTEDTLRFQIFEGPPPSGPIHGSAVDYRFHLTPDGRIEPSPAPAASEGSTSPTAPNEPSTPH